MTDTPDPPAVGDADSAPDGGPSYAVSAVPVPSGAATPGAASPDDATPDGATSDGAVVGRRRRWLAVAVAAVAVVALAAAVSLAGARLLGWWPAEEEPAAQPSPPAPTEAPSPFEGTPAEDFAEGADGIVLPEAEAVGEFTAEEVAEALEQVRRALIAARLDPTMLVDHDPDPFLALLAPDHQSGRRAEFESGDFAPYATQFAPDAVLLPFAPRVHGHISYEPVTVQARRQVLEVVTRFVWVYAAAASDDAEHERLVVHIREDLQWRVRGEPWLDSSRGLWLSDTALGAWGADCELLSQGLISPVRRATEEPTSIFDTDAPVPDEEGC